MSVLIFSLTNGLSLGAIYALSALGVSLVAGLMRVVNFAHGEFYVLGGYLSYELSLHAGCAPWLAMLLAVAGVFVVGLAVEWFLIQPTYGDPMDSLVITFVLSIVLQSAYLLIFGPYPKKPMAWAEGSVAWLGGTTFGLQRLLSGAIGLGCFGLFYGFVRFTRFGKRLRAVAQDPVMAAALGMSVRRINLVSFALACALGAIAGVILAPTFPITPMAGAAITVSASVVIVIGGIGSVRGCLAGGLILGLVESLGGTYLSTRYEPVFGFALLILMLWFKPSGLYGNRI